MRAPFFSVIIPTLNEEQTLPHLLLDLENQTMKTFEVMVVDGASTDRTLDFARATRRRDPRFQILRSRQSNVSIQRNLGAQAARGTWLLFLDADSRIGPEFLHVLRRQLTHASIDGFTCYAQADTTALDGIAYVQLQNVLLETMATLGTPYSIGACMGCRRAAFQRVGGFNPSIHHMEDSELAKRLYEQGYSFKVLRKPNFVYSLRRQRKEGKLAMISKLFPYYLKSMLSNEFSTPSKLYPMQGGANHARRKQTA